MTIFGRPTWILVEPEQAVDRNGQRLFRKDVSVKGLRPPEAALRALDRNILSKFWLTVAIDGVTRPHTIEPSTHKYQ
jgi:hypothetical protein